jgi:DNA-binding transcriptional ArsR family regulator
MSSPSPQALNAAESIDGVFRALADPTRRRVLERLGESPASVSELAAPFAMALPSIVQHVRGLVHSRKQGRVRTYRLATRRLRQAEDWLARQRTLWEQRLDQLDDCLIRLKERQS